MSKTKIYTFVNGGLMVVLLCCSVGSISYAGEYEKNGLPCVKEICIGDGVDELASVTWDRVSVNPNPKNIFYGTYIKTRDKTLQTYIGNTKNLTNYIGMSKFDSNAISHLGEVTATCDASMLMSRMVGTYKTKDGNLTEVEIKLIPDQQNLDSLTQGWVVTKITRSFQIASSQQRESVAKEMSSRYSFLDKNVYDSNGYPKKYVGTASFGRSIAGNNNELSLELLTDYRMKERASTYPGCPGSVKVKLD